MPHKTDLIHLIVPTLLFYLSLVSPVWGSEYWKILDSDHDALAARIELIQGAQTDINLMCYDIDDGQVVSMLLGELQCQAANGIRVRLLVDGLPTRKALMNLGDRLVGIDVRVFNPINLSRPVKINRRMHSKLMVVDQHALIIGSRNLTDKHFGFSEVNFVDCDVLIEGSLAKPAHAYFDCIWAAAIPMEELQTSTQLGLKNYRSLSPDRCRSCWGDIMTDVHKLHSNSTVPRSGMIDSHQIQLWNDATAGKNDRTMVCQVIRLIDSARHEILIESPYPAFSRLFSAAINRALRRGVKVTILTNSVATTDKISTQAAYQNQKAFWLRRGAALYDFSSCDQLHAKTLIVDRSIAWMGSYNFDARSERLNLELVIQVCDPEFVNALLESFQGRQSSSVRLTRRRPNDLAAIKIKDRAKLRVLQGVMPLLRPHL